MGKLSSSDVLQRLASVPQWSQKGDAIERLYQFPDFTSAMEFVNRVAKLAEKENHHPDIDIRYNKVLLSLTSHDSGGLTSRDFAMARSLRSLDPES